MDMDIRFGKALDSCLHDDVVLKRKWHEISSAGKTQVSVPLRAPPPGSSIRYPAKRRKLDGCNRMHSGSDFQSGKRLLRYYSNFKKSAPPQRLMYHHDDEWCDFPQEVVTCVKNDFLANKTTIEVDFEGNKNLVDFLHMTKLDLCTGLCQPIAWIDLSGKCFFPEIIGDCDEVSNDCDKDEGLKFQDINLHLEVEIKGLEAYKFKESSGESSGICQVQTYGNSSEEYAGTNSRAGGTKLIMNRSSGTIDKMEDKIDLVKGYMKHEAVKELFFRGIRASGQANIVELSSCAGKAIEARYELYLKQVEIMKRYRGDANVLYAWLPCSRKTVMSVLNYGVGCYGLSKIDPLHGLGVHLIPANGTDISERYFDVDENGMRYMVLCRVIMGNMELVPCGSNQLHPSSEEFDSGVDNIQNPKHYVVWNVNTNTHIYPEYVVTFKLYSDVKGPPLGNGTMVTAFPEESVPVVQGNVGLGEPVMSAKTPQSPYMSFSMLIAAISKRVPSSKTDIVKADYDLFRNKKINRVDFVRKLRSICGDALLKSAITSIQSKESPQSKCL